MRASLGRRVGRLSAHASAGCPACRALPSLGILWPEDPDPATACPGCGRAATGSTWVRFVQVDRGPA